MLLQSGSGHGDVAARRGKHSCVDRVSGGLGKSIMPRPQRLDAATWWSPSARTSTARQWRASAPRYGPAATRYRPLPATPHAACSMTAACARRSQRRVRNAGPGSGITHDEQVVLRAVNHSLASLVILVADNALPSGGERWTIR